MKRFEVAVAVLVGAVLLAPVPAAAWIWPEHRDIAAEALRDLLRAKLGKKAELRSARS